MHVAQTAVALTRGRGDLIMSSMINEHTHHVKHLLPGVIDMRIWKEE